MSISGAKTTTTESLLGLLSLRPMSGYEIRQAIEASIGNFWHESFGQIYPALKEMTEAGLVELEQEAGEGRADRKVYRLTEQGHGRLVEWLRIPARPQVPRNDLLLKIFFGDRAERGVMQAQVEKTRRSYAHVLERLKQIQERIEREHAAHPAMPFWRMTVRYGMAEAKAVMAWCEETLRELRAMTAADASERQMHAQELEEVCR